MNMYPSDINEWPQHMLTGPTKNICDAITEHNLWTWMKNESPPEGEGYCFWGHSNLKLIENDKEVRRDGHSGCSWGCSWGCSMRGAEMIAKNGFEAYQETCNKNNCPN